MPGPLGSPPRESQGRVPKRTVWPWHPAARLTAASWPRAGPPVTAPKFHPLALARAKVSAAAEAEGSSACAGGTKPPCAPWRREQGEASRGPQDLTSRHLQPAALSGRAPQAALARGCPAAEPPLASSCPARVPAAPCPPRGHPGGGRQSPCPPRNGAGGTDGVAMETSSLADALGRCKKRLCPPRCAAQCQPEPAAAGSLCSGPAAATGPCQPAGGETESHPSPQGLGSLPWPQPHGAWGSPYLPLGPACPPLAASSAGTSCRLAARAQHSHTR